MFRTWLSFSRLREKYLDLKDTEAGDRAVSFGVRGIVFALLCGGFEAVCYVAFQMSRANDVTSIFGIILLIGAAGCLLLMLIFGFFTTILQLKLNRRAVGFIALALMLAALAAAVVVVCIVDNG